MKAKAERAQLWYGGEKMIKFTHVEKESLKPRYLLSPVYVLFECAWTLSAISHMAAFLPGLYFRWKQSNCGEIEDTVLQSAFSS